MRDNDNAVTDENRRKEHLLRVVVASSRTPEWNTPADIIALVIAVLGEIDLDPCSNGVGAEANVPAHIHYDQTADGLAQRWDGRVYMNPPYGKAIPPWAAKFRQSYIARDMTEGIALVPARTDTHWFQEFDTMPVCFLHGRLKFSGAESSAPFPSAVIYAGPNPGCFDAVFSPRGKVRY